MTFRTRRLLYSTLLGALIGAVGARLVMRSPNGSDNPPRWVSSIFSGYTPPLWISLAVWVVFSLYWEIAANSAAPVARRESSASRGVHVTLVSIGQLMVFLGVPGLRARFVPASMLLSAAALAIQLLFLALAVWSRRMLGRNWSGAIAATEGQELVRAGPYRSLRHPIYTAVLGMYACTALISGEVHALIGLLLLIAAYWRKVRLEEDHLASHFGPSYREYRDATWGALPGLF
jgi:protein-S-isoprenylcysteine O-methyltransferase Ste14